MIKEKLLMELLNDVELFNKLKCTEKDGQKVLKENYNCKPNRGKTTSEKSDVVNLKLITEVE